MDDKDLNQLIILVAPNNWKTGQQRLTYHFKFDLDIRSINSRIRVS